MAAFFRGTTILPRKIPVKNTQKVFRTGRVHQVFLYFGLRIADTIWIYIDRFCRSFFSGTWRWKHKWTKSCIQGGMSQNSEMQFFMSASEVWSRILYFNSVCSLFLGYLCLETHLSRIPWSALESQPNQGFFSLPQETNTSVRCLFLRVSDWL